MNNQHALQMLGTTYSANAHAFSQRYQNCNQWLAELVASAWDPQPPGPDPRGQAQRWLKDQGYQPTPIALGWAPLMWVSRMLPWLHSDDHPAEDLGDAVYRVSMPASIESFVLGFVPRAHRIELCFDRQQIVVRRDGPPIQPGCRAEPGDEAINLPQS